MAIILSHELGDSLLCSKSCVCASLFQMNIKQNVRSVLFCLGMWDYGLTAWGRGVVNRQLFRGSFGLVVQPCPTLCDPMNSSTPSLPVHHQLPELAQTHVHQVSDAIQSSHPLSSPSPPTFNLSQHQGLFKWVSSLHQVAKVLERQLQHQSFQWIFRTDFL